VRNGLPRAPLRPLRRATTQVSQDEGKELAAAYGCPWMEASAKTRVRCEDCFYELVREIRKDKPKHTAVKQKKGSKCTIL
jgi:GTPase SAR1 family protein